MASAVVKRRPTPEKWRYRRTAPPLQNGVRQLPFLLPRMLRLRIIESIISIAITFIMDVIAYTP